MERRPSLEELLGKPDGPKLELSLDCNQCGKATKLDFEYAVVHPKPEECRAEGWDGVLLSRIVECRKCGAVDDYKLTPTAHLALMGQVLRRAHDAEGAGGTRIVLGASTLFDGTIVRRASQGIAHLRQVVEMNPMSAEAWRRLGNTLER